MTNTHTDLFINDWCPIRKGVKCACGRERGKESRYQMRAYALAVAVAMHGEAVCHCGALISMTEGEVDRTTAGCYRPGFVVMTCVKCNNDRTNYPEFNVVEFAADVLRASQNVAVPAKADAKRMYLASSTTGDTVMRSKYYRK